MAEIRLLAFDLDGTLLNSNKELTPRTQRALCAAAEAGVELVPTTGRFFGGMPAVVRALPFVRYAITINGAQVYDAREDRVICRAELPLEKALRVLHYLDRFPVIYDCYMDNWGWMTEAMQCAAADYVSDPHALRMIRTLRTPVPELKAFLMEKGRSVQKLQLFTPDKALRAQLLAELPKAFDALSVSSSVPHNIEINDSHANKGEALAALAAHLGLSMENTMGLGDGRNDVTLLRRAGLGVAMANAVPELLAVADAVSASCDADGAAAAIERYCLPGGIRHA